MFFPGNSTKSVRSPTWHLKKKKDCHKKVNMVNQIYINQTDRTKKMNAIIYCRVSTQEQAQTGFSLEAQREACTNYAKSKGYRIIKTFVERGESAKTLNRTELKNLIRYAKDNYNKIDALIIYKIDRLSRNQRNTANFLYDFRYILNIRIESVTENIDESPVGQYLTTIFSANAQLDNDIKSERITLAMKRAIKEGRWCWQAPKGYNLERDVLGKPILKPSKDAEHIQEAFNFMENGLYTQTEIVSILARRGFKVYVQTLNKMLRNPLYAGLIRSKWFPELIEGIHEPLISRETFFNVQKLLSGEKSNIAPREKHNPEFPLRGFVLCPVCKSPLTASRCKGKNKRIPYYWCWRNKCLRMIPKEAMETKFYDYLKNIQPKPEIMELLEYKMVHYWKEQNQGYKNRIKRAKAELTELKKMKDNLVRNLARGIIDGETYKEHVALIQKEILIHEETCTQEKIVDYDLQAYLKFGKEFLSNLSDIWEKSEISIKQRIQNFVFPSQIFFDGHNFEHPQVSSILGFIKNFSRNSNLVAPRGIEPLFDG